MSYRIFSPLTDSGDLTWKSASVFFSFFSTALVSVCCGQCLYDTSLNKFTYLNFSFIVFVHLSVLLSISR